MEPDTKPHKRVLGNLPNHFPEERPFDLQRRSTGPDSSSPGRKHFGIALVQGAPAPATPPLQIPGSVWFVPSTRPEGIPFTVHIDPTQCRDDFKIRLQIETEGVPLTIELPAQPNEQRRLNLDLRGRATLQTSLVDASGQSAGPTVTHIVFASP